MLFGCHELHVFMDHNNLIFATLNSQRVLRWRLFLEEYAPIFHYIKGVDNKVADALSRLPTLDSSEEKSIPGTYKQVLTSDDEESFYSMQYDDPALFDCLLHHPSVFDCYLNYPDPDVLPYPLHFDNIWNAQQDDEELNEIRQQEPDNFRMHQCDNRELICWQPDPQEDWRIVIPNAILDDVIEWYHQVLNHTGMTKMRLTMERNLWNPTMRRRIEEIVGHCDACQRYKQAGKGYGELPPREAEAVPWH